MPRTIEGSSRNAIYANGFRFVPRRFQLSPDDTMRFRIDGTKQVVSELGVNDQAAALGAEDLRAVPVCDVLLPSQSAVLYPMHEPRVAFPG